MIVQNILKARNGFNLDLRTIKRRSLDYRILQLFLLKVRKPPHMVHPQCHKESDRVLLTVFAGYTGRLCGDVVEKILVLVRSRFLVLVEV